MPRCSLKIVESVRQSVCAWWANLRTFPEESLDQSGNTGLFMAMGILCAISFDTFFCWHDMLYLATSEEDQIQMFIFLFGVVGYFIVTKIVDANLQDIYSQNTGTWCGENYGSALKKYVTPVKVIHFFLILNYTVRWCFMYPDDWNPVVYYVPAFYQWSMLSVSGCLLIHFCQLFITCYVLLNDRVEAGKLFV